MTNVLVEPGLTEPLAWAYPPVIRARPVSITVTHRRKALHLINRPLMRAQILVSLFC